MLIAGMGMDLLPSAIEPSNENVRCHVVKYLVGRFSTRSNFFCRECRPEMNDFQKPSVDFFKSRGRVASLGEKPI